MAKFLKSIFTSSEKRLGLKYEGEEGEDKTDFTPPLDDRRKLSISRSGRMKQANKKRHSLSLEVYGETNKSTEKPKSVEYHVNNPAKSVHYDSKPRRRHSGGQQFHTTIPAESESNHSKGRKDVNTPEEEIDRAFEMIDKIS